MPLDATRLTRLGRVSGVALSPDGSWLAVQVARLDRDDKKYVCDLWRVAADGSGDPVQLTRGEWSDVRPRFRRDGSLGFISDRGDDKEKGGQNRPTRQVWLLPAAGGEPRPLTDEPLGVHDFAFARAADRLAVIADVLPGVPHGQQRERAKELAERGPSGLHFRVMPVRFWDQWVGLAAPHLIAFDHDGGGRRDLTPDADREYRPSEFEFQWDLADDGRRAVLATRRTGGDRTPEVGLHLIDTDSGDRVELGLEAGATYSTPRFAPGGGQLAAGRWLREPGRCGRLTLQLFDLRGERRPLAEDWDAWPSIADWTPDGRALLCTADLRGDTPVFSVDAARGEVTRVTGAGSHASLVAAPDGRAAFGVRSTLLQPPEPFRVELAPAATPRLLANLSGLSSDEAAAFATVESFESPGDDGEPVQSFLVRPRGAARPPVLLWIHGGPVAQNADGWHWRWNPLLMVAAGYAVLLPNPRGSTGRGQEFIEGVWNNQWGAACYRDLMAVVDATARRADVDGDRIAAMGGSFGGYMANWIGGQTDRFRCLISHAGIFHFSSFHGTTDEPAFFALELGGSPYGDRAAFERHSPHANVTRWKSPTLILHGEKDYRCPVSEALLLFEALQMHGVESELVVFPDENHWILRPRNTRQWYSACLAFLARHMN